MSETVDREIVETIEPREPSKPQHMPSRRGSRKAATSATVEGGGKKAANTRGKATTAPKTNPKQISTATVTGLEVAGWILKPNQVQGFDGNPIAIWPIDRDNAQEIQALQEFSERLASLINRLPDPIRAMILRAASGGGWATDIFGLVRAAQQIFLPRVMTWQYAKTAAGGDTSNTSNTSNASPDQEAVTGFAWINDQAA